jgi:quinol monooxygenase YgiN
MSVIVIGHMTVEPGNVTKLWEERKADFEAVRTDAEAAGALHHRWAFGENEVVIIDEWPDAESFEKFFGSHTVIPQLMQAAGVEGPPTFEILEAKAGPDEF